MGTSDGKRSAALGSAEAGVCSPGGTEHRRGGPSAAPGLRAAGGAGRLPGSDARASTASPARPLGRFLLSEPRCPRPYNESKSDVCLEGLL